MQILIATNRSEDIFARFCEALRQEMENVELLFTNNGTNVLAAVKVMPPGFLILDQGLPEGEPLHLVRKLMSVNAAVNCIVITDLDVDAFHEAGEGLGIFAPLPVEPSFEDGVALARRMKRFMVGVGAVSG
ncbi:response regulator [Desulfonatronum lacustre]|uniref:response regulator n=1 Tax=Desulfonatronum lacustre TaxID=66849 RepID=UPI0004B97E5E|nr:response regulator [Desulfonatronum lacustre]